VRAEDIETAAIGYPQRMKAPCSRAAAFAVTLAASAASTATASAFGAGCSSESDEPGTDPAEAGPGDAAIDTTPSPLDAGVDARPARDCAADRDPDGVYRHLDCAGLYADVASRTLAPGRLPYKPALEFWSDGAAKTRFVYLPPGTTIDVTEADEWTFPIGTELWKEFSVAGKRIETRLFTKAAADDWKHTAYRWNADETDAVRKDEGDKVPSATPGAPPYEVPTTTQCTLCHGGRKEPVLGFDALSLGLAGATGQTLAVLASAGKLSPAPATTSFTLPDDGTTKAAAAMGWLHANCGSCHNRSSGAAGQFTGLYTLIRPSHLAPDGGPPDAKTLDAYTSAVRVTSLRQDLDAGAPFVRIVPGDPGASLVAILSGRRVAATADPDPNVQMPPVVTRLPDTTGHAALTEWIAAIPP